MKNVRQVSYTGDDKDNFLYPDIPGFNSQVGPSVHLWFIDIVQKQSYNTCTMSETLGRSVVQMLYKCFVFAGHILDDGSNHCSSMLSLTLSLFVTLS